MITPFRAILMLGYLGLSACAPTENGFAALGAEPNAKAGIVIRDGIRDEQHAVAMETLNIWQPRSISAGIEFCGYLGIDPRGELRSSEPSRGDQASCQPEWPSNGWNVLASWHTHGEHLYEYDNEVPSIDDMIGDLEDGVDGYIATPGGRMWLIDIETQRARQLCGEGCLISDPNYDPEEAGFVPQSLSLTDLYSRFDE